MDCPIARLIEQKNRGTDGRPPLSPSQPSVPYRRAEERWLAVAAAVLHLHLRSHALYASRRTSPPGPFVIAPTNTNMLFTTPDFRTLRIEPGFAERAVVIAGGLGFSSDPEESHVMSDECCELFALRQRDVSTARDPR